MTQFPSGSSLFFGQPRFASEEDRLRYELQQANATIARAREKPQLIGTVGCVLPGQRAIVYWLAFQFSIKVPDGCESGKQVLIAAESNSVLETLPDHVSFGAVVTVVGLTGHDILYDAGMAKASAFLPASVKARVGDKVQLDPTANVVLRNIGNEEPEDYVVRKSPGVSWEDIGGLDDAKEALREAIEYPITHAATYKAYGQKPSKGVLLSGPAGVGKTLLGKAVATALARDGDASGFIYVKAAEILNRFVGASEGNIRGLFQRARAHHEKTGNPAVLFIDEADAVLGRRDGEGLTMAITQTTVTMFLAEMDGLEDSGCFVMLSTNRPNSLDPAVVRDGRIDRKIHIGRPDEPAARRILGLALRGRELNHDASALTDRAIEMMFADSASLYELTFQHGSEMVRMRDALNGALIAGIVNRATKKAIRRDRDTDMISGIQVEDMEFAVRESYGELALAQHPELIQEKSDALGGARPTRVEKRAGRIQ